MAACKYRLLGDGIDVSDVMSVTGGLEHLSVVLMEIQASVNKLLSDLVVQQSTNDEGDHTSI